MDEQNGDVSFELSDEFVQRVKAVDALAHRAMQVQILFHMPDNPHVLQLFEWHMYDRLNIGLEQLCLIRAALENPNLAPFLIRYMNGDSPLGSTPEQTQRAHLIEKLVQLTGSEGDGVSTGIESLLMDRTDEALEARFNFVTREQLSFGLNFEGQSDAQSLANLMFSPETAYFKRLGRLLRHWIKELGEAPLHSVQVVTRRIPNKEELAEAARHTSDNQLVVRGSESHGLISVEDTRSFLPN